jgi:AcrR family transcriptional regulator
LVPVVAARPRRAKADLQSQVESYSAAQIRVATAATELFSTHGVAGTSLQMIADAIGVTKAAVYHQFNTKEAIVLACAEIQLATLERHLDNAESRDPERTRTAVLAAVVDLAVARRRTVGTLQNDPSIARLLAEHPPFRQIQTRLRRLLSGETATPTSQVRSAMIFAALTSAIAHPIVADLDDATLRRELLQLVERLLAPDPGFRGASDRNG